MLLELEDLVKRQLDNIENTQTINAEPTQNNYKITVYEASIDMKGLSQSNPTYNRR